VQSLLTKIERVPVATLTPYPGNPRHGDQQAIADSLTANQQYAPLIIQKSTRHVLVGNNTLAAAVTLGWEKIDVVTVDVDDKQARRILLSSNRTADLAGYDEQLLADVLAALDDGYDGTGWDDEAASELFRTSGHLGDEASSFLDDYARPPAAGGEQPAAAAGSTSPGIGGQASDDKDEDDEDSDPAAAQESDGTETVYVQVTWLVPPADRKTIHDALDIARQRWQLPTNAAALTALCADWITSCT
jgi:hypothetical protein